MIGWWLLRQLKQLFGGIYIVRKVPGIHVILINHKCYDHLGYDVIEYLNNNNKIRIIVFVYILVNGWKINLRPQKKDVWNQLMAIYLY